jgi:hypothetical protein
MAYADQGIELKPPFGIHDAPTPAVATAAPAEAGGLGEPTRPAVLSQRAVDALDGFSNLFKESADGAHAQLGFGSSDQTARAGAVRATGQSEHLD